MIFENFLIRLTLGKREKRESKKVLARVREENSRKIKQGRGLRLVSLFSL
jgi:hypothetical protein